MFFPCFEDPCGFERIGVGNLSESLSKWGS